MQLLPGVATDRSGIVKFTVQSLSETIVKRPGNVSLGKHVSCAVGDTYAILLRHCDGLRVSLWMVERVRCHFQRLFDRTANAFRDSLTHVTAIVLGHDVTRSVATRTQYQTPWSSPYSMKTAMLPSLPLPGTPRFHWSCFPSLKV